MKKHLIALGIVLLTSVGIAMGAENQEDRPAHHAASSSSVSSHQLSSQETETASGAESLPPKMDAQSLYVAFAEEDDNFEYKGGLGIFGILSEKAPKKGSVESLVHTFSESFNKLRKQNKALLKQNAELIAQIDNTKTDPNSTSAFLRVIKEAQEKADQERTARVNVEEDLKVADDRAKTSDAWARRLKEKEEKLLSEAKERDATIILNQEREKLLKTELSELKQVVDVLKENERKLKKLEAENKDLKEIQQEASLAQTSAAEEQASIKNVVERNDARIKELAAENNELKRKEQEKEKRIAKLKQATEANDFYAQIEKRIKDPSVSDEDLALFIWAVKTVKGMDLDDLSVDHSKRLIELIIDVSRPYEGRPSGKITCTYEGCTRTLGNDFVAGGLVWNGVAFNMSDCKFKGSNFEKRTVEFAKLAREKFREHK